MNSRGDTLALMKGTLDMLVLSGLSRGPMHGYGIATWLEERSSGELAVEDSAVYQALRRLEGRGMVDAEWGTTENNRRARYYRLTEKGRERLAVEADAWERYSSSVAGILDLAHKGGSAGE